ncbi:MAG TPA: lipase family protein [Iamia sp.]|nr:lipase family protein [Iamia sp.]
MIRAPRRLLAVAVAVALLGAGCSDDGGDDDAAPSPETASTEAEAPEAEEPEAGEAAGPVEVEGEDALYATPDPIPAGEHGDLLRYQEISPSPVEGGRGYRVMYLSESLEGDPIVVTGTVVVPTAEAPAEGRPVLTIAHGTTGIADECAPSREGAAELAVAGPAIERGWILAVTDYEGLGTPGRHPYLVGESEGRGVIDAARAAAQLPEAEAAPTTLIAGYSQGGHGALWAGEVAAEWAPELDVVGTFAGAPATELDVILAAAGSPGVAGFAALMVAGFAAAYPEADPALFLTEEGVARLDAVDEGCVGDVFTAMADLAPEELVRAEGPSTAPWPELAAANNPGQVATEAPVLIIHSAQDEVVPVALSAALFDRMCAAGQAAERRVLDEGGGHGAAAVVAYPDALAWFDRILAGETVENTCR